MSHLHTNCSMSRLHTNSYKSRVHTSVLARPKRQGAAPCCFFLRPVVFQALFSVISGLNLPKSIEIKAVRRAEAHNVSGFMYCVVMDTRFMSQSNHLFLTHVLFTFCFSHFTRSPCLRNESYQRLINGASYPQRKHAPCNKER